MSDQNDQKLVDICFQIALTMYDRYPDYFQNTGREKVAAWVAQQLEASGFQTKPCGASWGILTNKETPVNPGLVVNVSPETDQWNKLALKIKEKS
jgi:hypothetical protein